MEGRLAHGRRRGQKRCWLVMHLRDRGGCFCRSRFVTGCLALESVRKLLRLMWLRVRVVLMAVSSMDVGRAFLGFAGGSRRRSRDAIACGDWSWGYGVAGKTGGLSLLLLWLLGWQILFLVGDDGELDHLLADKGDDLQGLLLHDERVVLGRSEAAERIHEHCLVDHWWWLFLLHTRSGAQGRGKGNGRVVSEAEFLDGGH